MMLVGGVLNANTVLQPQFMQQLLGYNATTAGLALTAGGVALVIVMPMAGFATGKISARTLAVAGFIMFIVTFRYAAYVTNLQMSFAQASWLRVVQMLPLPFCFISITNAAYVGMPKEESNQVAGLINFVRNIGGSILIAITNAQVTSRAMWHQQHLQAAMQSGSDAFTQHQPGADGLPQRHLRRPQQRRHGSRIHLQPAQPAGADAGLPGCLHGAFMDVVLPRLLAFMLSANRPGQGPGASAMH